MTNNTNKYWILVLILAVGGTYYFLSKKQEKERRAFEETVTAEIKKLGNSLQAGGNIVSYQDLEKRMEASLGKKVTEEIEELQSQTIEDLKEAEKTWTWLDNDWIDYETGELLTNYKPEESMLRLIKEKLLK